MLSPSHTALFLFCFLFLFLILSCLLLFHKNSWRITKSSETRPALLPKVVLSAAVSDASTPVLEMPLLSKADADAVLEGFNPLHSGRIPLTCLHNLFEHQADLQPDAPCIRTPQQSLSYKQVEQRANALARGLQSQGLGAGSVVGLLMDRTPALYIAILAVLKAGAAYMPMDAAYPSDRLTFMAEDANIQVLITTSSLVKLVENIAAEVHWSLAH